MDVFDTTGEIKLYCWEHNQMMPNVKTAPIKKGALIFSLTPGDVALDWIQSFLLTPAKLTSIPLVILKRGALTRLCHTSSLMHGGDGEEGEHHSGSKMAADVLTVSN